MRRIGAATAIIGLWIGGIACGQTAKPAVPATQPVSLPAMPDRTPPGEPHFDARGAQVGEQVPDLTVYSLDGKPQRLADAWQHGNKTLLITSSYTCPKSRSEYPRAAALAKPFNGNVNLVVIYVVEAHPNVDPSPYSGKEDVTAENIRDHVLCRQPRTLADRLTLAKKFANRFGVQDNDMYVDAMDNAAWKSLGGGPNMGVLVDDHGIVLARQGWFDEPSMEAAAKVFAAVPQDEWREPQAKDFGDRAVEQPTIDGDLAKVQAQIAKSPELIRKIFPYVERGGGGDRTLLQYAVENNRMEIAKFLIGRGADVNVQMLQAPSALHMAAKAGELAMAQLLVAHGAIVNRAASDHGPTPVQEALVYGHPDVADFLQKAGAKTNFFTDVAEGHVAAVQAALAADASIAMRPDGWRRPPLVYAAGANQPAMVKLLQAIGAYDLPGESDGWPNEGSAILWAVRAKNLPMVRLLCDTGSDPNLVNDTESVDVIRELLAHKADPNQPTLSGDRPIYYAAGGGRLDLLQALVDAGADVNAQPGPDNEPCGPGRLPNDPPPADSALHWAARAGSAKAVAYLLQHGAKINALDGQKNTPLHAAADGDSTPDRVAAVAALIAAHADVNARNRAGQTPLDLALLAFKASDKPDHAVVDFLKAHGGK